MNEYPFVVTVELDNTGRIYARAEFDNLVDAQENFIHNRDAPRTRIDGQRFTVRLSIVLDESAGAFISQGQR